MPHVAPHFPQHHHNLNLWFAQATRTRRCSPLPRPLCRRAAGARGRTMPWVSLHRRPHHVDRRLRRGRAASAWRWSRPLDNLLKGAATQALQNLNMALGLDELSRYSGSADAA